MKVLTQGRWLWTRTIGSTLIGQGVDTLLFVAIAFAGTVPWSLFWSIVISNYIFKVGLETIMTPGTYRAIAFLKKEENVDVYDTDTDFNPFKLSID